MTRRARPKNFEVDVDACVQDLKPLSLMKDCGFSWSACEYAKPSRQKGADMAGLLRFEPALSIVLKHAPTGFPTFRSLRTVFSKLHEEAKVFGDLTSFQLNHTLDHTSDKWRIMCKHVYNLSKLERPPPSLKKLWSMIDGGSCAVGDSQGASSSNAPALEVGDLNCALGLQDASEVNADEVGGLESDLVMPNLEDLKDMFPDLDDDSLDNASSDVEIVDMLCNCAACVAKRAGVGGLDPMAVDSGDDELVLQTKSAEVVDLEAGVGDLAKDAIPIPPAGKGQQKKMTVGAKATTKAAKAVAKKKRGRGSTNNIMKKPSGARSRIFTNCEITMPIYVVSRHTPRAQTYLMQRNPKKYIAGQTGRTSTRHKENIDALAAAIRGGHIVDTKSAREFLANRQ